MVASVATFDYPGHTISGQSPQAEVWTDPARGDELPVSQQPAWFQRAARKVLALMSLEENWDSYGGRAVSLATARHAVQLLECLGDMGVPAPRVVPTSAGGVQYEWDVDGVELELELKPSGRMLAIFDDPQGESWEQELPPCNLMPLNRALRRLALVGQPR